MKKGWQICFLKSENIKQLQITLSDKKGYVSM